MPDLKLALWFLGTLATIMPATIDLRRLYQLLYPIWITSSTKVVFDGSGPDQILARVTNVSGEDQVLVRCVARSTYPLRTILLRHLREPFTHPKLYKNIRYAGISFSLMGASPIKLMHYQREELHYSVKQQNPLEVFPTSMIQIEVELSTGRVFHSERIEIPDRWRFRPRGR